MEPILPAFIDVGEQEQVNLNNLFHTSHLKLYTLILNFRSKVK